MWCAPIVENSRITFLVPAEQSAILSSTRFLRTVNVPSRFPHLFTYVALPNSLWKNLRRLNVCLVPNPLSSHNLCFRFNILPSHLPASHSFGFSDSLWVPYFPLISLLPYWFFHFPVALIFLNLFVLCFPPAASLDELISFKINEAPSRSRRTFFR